jgi:non-canonical (house-cleaning) NTP pyrophosphatase
MNDPGSLERFRLADSLGLALAGRAVRVGTENRAKLAAVRIALESLRGEGPPESHVPLRIVPVDVASDVPEQPIGWSEIQAGARNRARAALASGDCALGIGIEDGLVRLSDEPETDDLRDYFNVGCAWVTDGERDGRGFSSGFAYPPESLEPAIREQAPIGTLFDALWRRHRPRAAESDPDSRPTGKPANSAPSGRSGGNIGLLTGGRLDRSAYGSQAVVCALVPFLHTDLYD